MPRKFEIEGGSCYQGITATIIRFFLEISAILNLIAIIFLYRLKPNSAKTLSIIAVIVWFIITLFNTINKESVDFINSIIYFTPFLAVNLFIIIVINRIKKLNL
ncbi:hypothetical protein AR687_09675 [Flavobacteriaceae bacterium CRH]|nr:hypothetical protein AR687_09675 [Flavobacteriaceae bacterium CRH]